MARTVLICDDALFMRTMLAEIMEQAGFEVVGQAGTGAEAVKLYRELEPDLVTMDIIMGQQALVIEAIQAGARDFVVKPFQPARVLEAVQRVLG
jgi:two-component system chemotaxis response regulator CheY